MKARAAQRRSNKPAASKGAATAKKADNRRGSPEAVKKRRAARHFNELLSGASSPRLDGRTEKRKERMMAELREGKLRASGRPLKPIDILVRVEELLDLGEPLASIKKVAKPSRPVQASPDVISGLKSLHAAYGFRPEVYAFVGLDQAICQRAGIGAPAAGKKKGLRPLAARRPDNRAADRAA
jgi:hypothetical protein